MRKRVLDICDEIEQRGLKGLKISCGNGLRADKVDKELLSRMKEVGFHYIAFGVDKEENTGSYSLYEFEWIEDPQFVEFLSKFTPFLRDSTTETLNIKGYLVCRISKFIYATWDRFF